MNIARLYHTLKYLRFEQFYYRLYYRLKAAFYRYPAVPGDAIEAVQAFPKISFPPVSNQHGYNTVNKTFTFLNESHSFGKKIDWNYSGKGKLWTYNLNYFEWLADENLTVAGRLDTIKEYVESKSELRDGAEPYPISVRGMNWIKFLSRFKIHEPEIDSCLYQHFDRLAAFPEYQLLANHLLENGFALLFAGHYFNSKKFNYLAHNILRKELREQILPDGGHYEQSPMYHCIILHHLLDCIMLAEHSGRYCDGSLLNLMKDKAGLMCGWLKAYMYKDGSYAMMGDATLGVAPVPEELFAYAGMVGIGTSRVELKESGYRRFEAGNAEIVFDAGNIQPSYQAGHAHADTLNFCVQMDGKPFITDTGISTYERGMRRAAERGTSAHNTIVINGGNSSDVWAAFRTGERAKVTILDAGEDEIVAEHDGYRRYGVVHRRAIRCNNQKIMIEDTLSGLKEQEAKLYLHFHPSVLIEQTGADQLRAGNIRVTITGSTSMGLHNYLYCEGYNRLTAAKCLEAHVREHVTVIIEHY